MPVMPATTRILYSTRSRRREKGLNAEGPEGISADDQSCNPTECAPNPYTSVSAIPVP
jgi:hypothetical protein